MTISQILAAAASREGLEVRLFEGTGITQRGGGVYAFVRFGEAYSPRIPVGEADTIVSLEISEVITVIHFLKSGGQVWTSSEKIHGYYSKLYPQSYPDQERIETTIRLKTEDLHVIPGDRLAQEAEARMAVNMVMMGAFSRGNDFLKTESITGAIGQTNPKFAEPNLKAFWKGYQFVEKGERLDDR
jgi:indolepyruvate ferredoxin oxidoreductase beta subunit